MAEKGKMEWHRQIKIRDKDDQTIAVVDKVISIKRKSQEKI